MGRKYEMEIDRWQEGGEVMCIYVFLPDSERYTALEVVSCPVPCECFYIVFLCKRGKLTKGNVRQ